MPSDLPIVTPDPPSSPSSPKRGTVEKYGGLYYFGIAGLAVVVALVTWFGAEAWSLRAVFRGIYVLHDETRPEAERIDAAYGLSLDGAVTQRQYWDIAFRKRLPPLARYVVAEALTSEAVATDPRGYALAAGKSEGWPDWFRLLIARPLAYAADDRIALPREPIISLTQSRDPWLRAWSLYTLAAMAGGDDAADAALERLPDAFPEVAELVALLLAARSSGGGPPRLAKLSEATRIMRRGHPEAAALWHGWDIRDGHLITLPTFEAKTPTPPDDGAQRPGP